MANVEALIAMGTSPESPKATPPVNRSQRLTLAKKLTPQVTLCSKCCEQNSIGVDAVTQCLL